MGKTRPKCRLNSQKRVVNPMATGKLELVFISTPGIGNLVPLVEFAHLLVDHDPRFSATILIVTMPQRPLVNTYVQSRAAAASNIRLVHLPAVEPPSPDQFQNSIAYISMLIEKHRPQVKHAITDLMAAPTESDSNQFPSRIAGLFIDMFTTSMIDVANELGVPCYLYFASPATFLGFMLHLPILDSKLNPTELSGLDFDLVLPEFVNPVPPSVLPPSVLQKEGYAWFLHHARRYAETKGIIVNTFVELEPHSVNGVRSRQVPAVYPIGPVLDLAGPAQWHPDQVHHRKVMTWLDDQPPSSVVFLCFGSMGSLSGPQVKEIAIGLERTGLHFLWALRGPPETHLHLPSEYKDPDKVLPNGFLERTAGVGLVCGWVSQVSILAHKAIGGFVSHCGWNSILESLWHGVPIATWPVYAEQQMNAFQMVRELGLAMEITLDYRAGSDLVVADEVERGIKRLMDGDDEVRTKVKEMGQKSRKAMMENGSSYTSLGALIEELAGN
ncbi:hypothetical protein F2P56_008977 [Juglans regia]|uniref:Glycosyltransferase n=2 Tax=Juglans regia TaxID=51240 RepID=A0A833XNI8_JUGRE|nr:UDP-glycosyltransferase 43-like [Juglans regia]KAF5472241.1 hypothetical protein F2P56_008977 [Juglans regia]